MTKIIVTGCAGFIGSHTAEELLKQGHDVVGIDEVNDYYSVEQKEKNLEILKEFSNFTFYKKDISNAEGMEKIFKEQRPEVVINLAARAGVRASIDNPILYENANIRGVLVILELCHKFNVKQFINASSSSVYGNRTKVPFSEDDPVTKPVSPYAATKRSSELFCYTYHYLYDMNIACLRFFTVYGPRGRPDMAPFKFTKAIQEGKEITRYGDGSSRRDYTYVKDIVQGIIKCIGKDLGYEIINLGNNHPVSLNDFIAIIENILGKKALIKQIKMPKADVNLTYADISKAKRLLNYEPKTSLEEGMKKFADWLFQ